MMLLLVLLLCAASLARGAPPPQHRGAPPPPRGHGAPPPRDSAPVLGEEEAKRLRHLPLHESLRRLSLLVDRMDEDRDGLVSEDELKLWIGRVQLNRTLDQVQARWDQYDRNRDGLIGWEEYKDIRQKENLEPEFNFSRVLVRERRRFSFADADGDGAADKMEFTAFLHPEDHQHMRGVLVQETLEELDTNGDGFIDMNEFIEDLQAPEEGAGPPEEGAGPPEEGAGPREWVETERQHFSQTLDRNQDGRLDQQEILDWILPPDGGFASAEAKHLLDKSDTDQDGKLSRSEVLKNHEMFVGSQATDYGDALRNHDEF